MRITIRKAPLSDGSAVWDVWLRQDTNVIVLAAMSYEDAEKLAEKIGEAMLKHSVEELSE